MITERSVIIPAFDEVGSLPDLLWKLDQVLDGLEGRSEVIVVDDGSSDGTAAAVAALGLDRVRVIPLLVNRGKSHALRTGLEAAVGEVIVLMDADGQDDPTEIPRLLAALQDHELVTGRRAERRDGFIKRTTSRLYNRATGWVTGIDGRDFNSGLKVMRSSVADDLPLYGELHRYLPVLAAWSGHRVGEVDVVHRERTAGRSKFGRQRYWRGFLDLVTVKFLVTYDARPFHLFGGIAAGLGGVGAALLTWMLVLRMAGHTVGDRPALLAGILLVLVAVQLGSLGLIAELVIHLSSRDRYQQLRRRRSREG